MKRLRHLLRTTNAPELADKGLKPVPIILSVLLTLSVIGSFMVMEPVIRTYIQLFNMTAFWAYTLFYIQVVMTALAVPALLRLRMPEVLRVTSILLLVLMAVLALISIPMELLGRMRLSTMIINALSGSLILVSLKIIQADGTLKDAWRSIRG